MKQAAILFLLVFLFGCSKEEIQRNAVMNAMTQGQWKITSFKDGTTDITTLFTVYTFQFKENYTVDVIHNNSIEKTGTWTADINALTITAAFPNVTDPLNLLNGTWHITNSDWSWVEAYQTVNGEQRRLRMEKL
jgi:hypothetical protein